MPNKLRYFDRHRRRIDLSELLRQSGRRFQLAVQIGLLEYSDMTGRISTRPVCRMRRRRNSPM